MDGSQFGVVLERIEGYFKTIAEGQGAIEGRLTGLETKVDKLDVKVDRLDLRASSLEMEMREVKQHIGLNGVSKPLARRAPAKPRSKK